MPKKAAGKRTLYAYAAYNPLPPGIVTPIIPGGFIKMYDQIQNVLHADGFENVKQYNYSNSFFNFNINTAGHTIGHRKITGLNGSERSLIVVAVRGTAPDIEWITNVASLADSDQSGFRRAAIDARTNFNRYVNDPLIKPKLVNPIVLVTGHSLGAAVANLLATDLNASTGAGWGKGKVFAYTFASPNVGKNIPANQSSNNNIFNIINQNDLVPTLPPAIFGFNGRYGREAFIAMTNEPMIRVDINHAMDTYWGWMKSKPDNTAWMGN